MRDPGLEIAIKAAGGVASLARGIGIAQPSVSAWSQIPAKRVLAIEALTRVDRFVLRPDLYGPYQDHTAKPEADAIDRLRAAGFGPLSKLPPDADGVETQDRFATLYLDELGLARAESISSGSTPDSDESSALEARLRDSIVAELKRQAANNPHALSVSDSGGLIVNGNVDLNALATAVADAAFKSR